MPWQQRMIRRHARVCSLIEALALYDGRRRVDMEKERGIGDQPFPAHQPLRIESAVGTAEAHMALSRNLPSNSVVRHIVSLDAKTARPSLEPTGRPPFALRYYSSKADSRAAPWQQRGSGSLF